MSEHTADKNQCMTRIVSHDRQKSVMTNDINFMKMRRKASSYSTWSPWHVAIFSTEYAAKFSQL